MNGWDGAVGTRGGAWGVGWGWNWKDVKAFGFEVKWVACVAILRFVWGPLAELTWNLTT